MKFDYVIAGGGTTGLLLANRLSADPGVTVAVVDPGGDARGDPNVTDPTRFLAALGTPVDWAYPSAPQAGAAGRTLAMHAGRALGGTSAINGMTYVRADAAEVDAWAALGARGWSWDALLPYYERTERFAPPTAAQAGAGGASFEARWHGARGLLDVGFLYELPNGSLCGLVRDAWGGLGYAANPDLNRGDTRGFGVWPMTVDRDADLRWDAATAYYWPVEGGRDNLRLLRGTVIKLVWASGGGGRAGETATGVRYVDADNNTVTVDVGREVILSAGALRSPLILEASGIGNPQVLARLGIDTVVDLVGVGENLIEQPNTNLIFSGDLNVTGYPTYATFANADDVFGPDKASVAAATRANLTRWAASIAAASGDGLNATAIERVLRVQHDLMFEQNVTIAETITTASGALVVTPFWCLFPFSRGSVHLGAVDLVNSPVIDPRYFLVDFDMTMEIAIGKQAQAFFRSHPMQDHISLNVTADPGSDQEWAEFIASTFAPNHHEIGTAAMMSRELGGVVDEELRVYGTKNVRVVDASVLPLQVSGHLTATLYAVAERASDMIKAGSQEACLGW